MKPSALIPWILAGGLAASTIFNIRLMHRLDEVEARLQGPRIEADESIALPNRIVTKLGLTEQQCERILDCSLH